MENETAVPHLKTIVLKELVAEKNPKLASRLPGFVYGLVNRILHIREVNEIIRRYGHLKGIPFISAVLEYFDVKVVLTGVEKLPVTGTFIFASNHPLGGFDGLMLIKAGDRPAGEIVVSCTRRTYKDTPSERAVYPGE